MKRIAIVNGPNLDRLGQREPEIYGRATLADLEQALRAEFGSQASLEFFQSNHEGALIDQIAAFGAARYDGLVLNGAAFTHTSVALRDALAGSGLRTVEVHISNIYRRESFRHQSLTAPVCVGVISGLGLEGYHAAVRFLLKA
ncbi:type II 3-dehydroquinate dehydratase [Opitutus terrae]|uniref:3-dehydroquinate dehydratase n=1 Tax=Opitutus terrae (strain DSM 11246 / JCM 15787 / PB90-1) TaxID=452637 RepID=B1ZWG2_OPITP|nr:type II 3-dehydroquinate dehydratase [Opitutus terrae]ACB76914.1 3-dehydroquinate dehydratase, type II [Opitutus terrae PB90-1]